VFAGPEIAGNVLRVDKSKQIGNLRHRQVRFHQQLGDLIGSHSPDFIQNRPAQEFAEPFFQRAPG
jgi:hypothetical protein